MGALLSVLLWECGEAMKKKPELKPGPIFCNHPEPTHGGFCSDCEQNVNVLLTFKEIDDMEMKEKKP